MSTRHKSIRLFAIICLLAGSNLAFSLTVIIEDDFTNPAGLMPNEQEGFAPMEFPPDGEWQSNGGGNNVYDGGTSLQMPRDGAWLQYIDSRRVSTEIQAGKTYAFLVFVTYPSGGSEPQTFGFGVSGNWSNDFDRHRVFKMQDGNIIFSNYTFTPDADLDTGQDYTPDVEVGLMMKIDAAGAITLWRQDGVDKDPNSSAWVDITPASDPDGVLTIAPGINIIGVNCPGGGGGTFLVDYIALVEDFEQVGPPPEGIVVFDDHFSGNTDDEVSPLKWITRGPREGYNQSGGEGRESDLIMFAANNAWNNPALASVFTMAASGLASYRVDVLLSLANPALAYVGLEESGGDRSRDRGFLIHNDASKVLRVTTDPVNGTGLSTAVSGVETNANYPTGGTPPEIDSNNIQFGLRMIILTNGTLQWFINQDHKANPDNYVAVTPIISTPPGASGSSIQADLNLLGSIPLGPGRSYRFVMHANTGSDLIVDRVTIRDLTQAGGRDVPIIFDDFTNAAGNMPNEQEGFAPMEFPPDGEWQSNGGGNNVYDGVTSLEMPRDGAWLQYIDSRRVTTDLQTGTSYAFLAFVRYPAAGTDPQTFGFGVSGNWSSDFDRHRVFKMQDGDILFSDYTFTPGVDLDTGQDYTPGVKVGLMMWIDENGDITLWQQNGADKTPGSPNWFNITPASDPDGLLAIAAGVNLIGVNCPGGGGGTFSVDYIGLFENPSVPGTGGVNAAVYWELME